jgi:cytidine deaminase
MDTSERQLEALREAATSAAAHAYAPYSHFPVGAAVLTENGEIHAGCNVENASYGLTICAERSAVFRAVTEGQRRIKVVVIVGGDDSPAPPCGACRQVISEFGIDAIVYSFSRKGAAARWTMSQLLPASFTPLMLEGKQVERTRSSTESPHGHKKDV